VQKKKDFTINPFNHGRIHPEILPFSLKNNNMKKLIFFGAMLLLVSCSDVSTYLNKEEQNKTTTLELQFKCDTIQEVYIVEKGSQLYILNKDKTVIIKTGTPDSVSDVVDALFALMLVIWLCLIIMFIFM